MRNQFFGDVYDYIKYGLIRRLTNYGERPSALCWMMREDEDNTEGRITSFQEDLGVRSFDPPVFDLLVAMRDRNERDVRVIERSGLLPNTRFYTPILTDYADQRRDYFDQFFVKAKDRELICFDPDTGIQGQQRNVAPGGPESSKYLMRDEVRRAFKCGHSLLIFVHKARVENKQGLVKRTQDNLIAVEGAEYLLGFIHKNASFFLVPQSEKVDEYERIAKQVEKDWPEIGVVEEYLALQAV